MSIKLKSYLRNRAPVFVYKYLSKVFHIPYNFKNTFFKQKGRLENQEIVNINYKEISYELVLKEENGYVDQFIYSNHEWEPKVTALIYENLKSEDYFIDVGGNIGFFSLLAAKKVGLEGKVFVFEPIKKLADQIRFSSKINNIENITIYETGCSDAKQELSLGLHPENIGKSSVLDGSKNDLDHISIQLDTLDHLLADLPRIDLIKIDVEGHESEVLCGAQNLIHKHRPKIIFEYNPKRIIEAGKNTEGMIEMMSYITSLDYRIFTIKGDEIKDFVKFSNRKNTIGSYIEIFCTPSA